MQTTHTFNKQISTARLVDCCIFDVSLYADYSPNVKESLNVDILKQSFLKGNISPVFAQYLFPCQTRATERSEFNEWKSSVLGESIPAPHVGGWGYSRVAHVKCVTDTQRVSGNAYQRSGYIVTPLERCMLQHVSL